VGWDGGGGGRGLGWPQKNRGGRAAASSFPAALAMAVIAQLTALQQQLMRAKANADAAEKRVADLAAALRESERAPHGGSHVRRNCCAAAPPSAEEGELSESAARAVQLAHAQAQLHTLHKAKDDEIERLRASVTAVERQVRTHVQLPTH
jgi:hypothetical protein